MKQIRKDAGVLSSAPAIASAPQVAETLPTPNADDESADEEDEPKGDSEQDERDIPDPLSKISKYVRHLGVKKQYERKSRNEMLKINNFPEIIKANREGKLVVNGQAVPDSNFASLFRSVFSKTHDLAQPGINQFLGALR